MAGNDHNDESQTGPNPTTKVPMDPDIPTTAFKEWLETLPPWNANGSRSHISETNPPSGVELTNLLLLEMLQKQGEQLRPQKEQIQRLMDVKEKRAEEDNSYMFKRFAGHHPPVYDGTPDPKTFNEQRGTKRKGDNQGTFQMQEQSRRLVGGQHSGSLNRGGQYSNTRPKVTCNACRKSGHFA